MQNNRLSILQQWVYQSITHPAGVEQGAQAAAHALPMQNGAVQHIVKASATLTAVERLAIYHNAYHLRLMGVLEAEYPALKQALGDDLFTKFALFYLQQNPSANYTLFQLSAQLPDFLAATVPHEDAEASWPNFILDLVKLERMFQEIYRGPGLEGQPLPSLADLQALYPYAWHTHTLQAAPCLRLMHSQYPVHQYLLDARQHSTPELPDPSPSWIAVCRHNYQVKIFGISEAEYTALDMLLKRKSFQAAGIANPESLGKWMGAGFFASIKTLAD